MTALLANLKRRIFWVVARTCFFLYRTFPLFGPLRASIGIVRRGPTFLLIERNDGRGYSLPGGIAGWREKEEETLRREVREETGLTVLRQELRMRFQATAEVPANVAVFEVEATGEVKNSWEGTPRWLSIEELEPRLMESQRAVLELMKKICAAGRESGGAERQNNP